MRCAGMCANARSHRVCGWLCCPKRCIRTYSMVGYGSLRLDRIYIVANPARAGGEKEGGAEMFDPAIRAIILVRWKPCRRGRALPREALGMWLIATSPHETRSTVSFIARWHFAPHHITFHPVRYLSPNSRYPSNICGVRETIRLLSLRAL